MATKYTRSKLYVFNVNEAIEFIKNTLNINSNIELKSVKIHHINTLYKY